MIDTYKRRKLIESNFAWETQVCDKIWNGKEESKPNFTNKIEVPNNKKEPKCNNFVDDKYGKWKNKVKYEMEKGNVLVVNTFCFFFKKLWWFLEPFVFIVDA